jgi:hypothetical protein
MPGEYLKLGHNHFLTHISQFIVRYHRTGLYRGKALDLYPGSVLFDSQTGYQISSVRFFVVFLGPSKKMPG